MSLLFLLLVVQALDRVEEEVNALAECCDKIAKALSSCSASAGDIISTTERLKHELEVTTQHQEIVSCFLRDYQLSNEEIHALREEDLSENFFKAVSHVQEIHANCKILLRTHHQRAGLELMDMMAVYQEGAYERLCRFQSCWADKQLSVTHFGSSRMLHNILSSSRALSSSPGCSSLTFGCWRVASWGKDIRVMNDNVVTYIHLIANHRLNFQVTCLAWAFDGCCF